MLADLWVVIRATVILTIGDNADKWKRIMRRIGNLGSHSQSTRAPKVAY